MSGGKVAIIIKFRRPVMYLEIILSMQWKDQDQGSKGC